MNSFDGIKITYPVFFAFLEDHHGCEVSPLTKYGQEYMGVYLDRSLPEGQKPSKYPILKYRTPPACKTSSHGCHVSHDELQTASQDGKLGFGPERLKCFISFAKKAHHLIETEAIDACSYN